MITRDDWLSAIAAVTAPVDPHPEAVTIAEFCDLLGLKTSSAKDRMRTLVKAGKAQRVLKPVVRDGRRLTIPAYVLIQETPDVSQAHGPRNPRRRGADRGR